MARGSRALLFMAVTMNGVFLMFLLGNRSSPFDDAHATAFALLSLALSIPIVDDAFFRKGCEVSPALAAALFAPGLGFFIRQHLLGLELGNMAIASGAEKVLGLACLVALMVRGARLALRWYRRDRLNRPC